MATMNLYGLGGAGSNIVSHFNEYCGRKTDGHAVIQTYFVDTSRSNLARGVPEDQVYLVDGLDGSGKKRSSNYEILSERGKEILHQFKPADFNIVVHSASGGSGSVIGPILVSEMLSRGITPIVLLVGNTSSRIEAENTLKTLQSYEVISQKRETPVIVAYEENTTDTPRGHVDNEMQTKIVLLSMLLSGENRELDGSDLRNFLNYTTVTTFRPKLSYLDLFSEKIVVEKGQHLVSLLTLVDEDTPSEVEVLNEYQAVGYISEAARANLNNVSLPIHAAIIDGYFNNVVARLEKKLQVYREIESARVEKSIVSGVSGSTSEGLIL